MKYLEYARLFIEKNLPEQKIMAAVNKKTKGIYYYEINDDEEIIYEFKNNGDVKITIKDGTFKYVETIPKKDWYYD